MTEHQMNLAEIPFTQIRDGIKTLEIRLFDEKRKTLEIGDLITFSFNNQKITMQVFGLSRFSSFVDLFTTLGGMAAGWSDKNSPNQMAQDMREYYSEEEEKKYGVLGIHIKPVIK